MYRRIECVSIHCDKCDDMFEERGTDFTLFVEEEDAKEKAEWQEWYCEDNKHYCPKCYTIDDDDNLIIKS